MNKRKALGYTQQTLADRLNVSFQAISKWENGTNYPEIEMLPMIASVLDTSIDSLLGYKSFAVSDYDKRYDTADYYWGITPNDLCYEIMKLRPPVKPLKVLDIGCGEGKDAVFLARNGYIVTAFDLSEAGIEKGKKLAEKCNNVFVDKPFVEVPPDKDVNRFRWNSGELFMLYHDWKLHKIEEVIFNCNSGGIPHQHCMDIMLAERGQ